MKILRSLTFCMLVGAAGYGQALDLKHLDKLADKASNKVEVTLDGSVLKMAAKFLSDDNDPDSAKIKKLVNGLKGIYVKTYEFEKEGEYSESDIAGIRKQLESGWSRIVGIQSKKDGDNAEIYLKTGGTDGGLAILCAGAKELTVVNIVGKIDLDQLSELGGNMGVPKIDVEKPKPPKKDD
jgi:hypothetical protein